MRTRFVLPAALAVLTACSAEPPAAAAPGERPPDLRDLAAAEARSGGLGAAGRLPGPLRAAARSWVEAADRSVRGVLALAVRPESERPRLAAAHLAARADALEALAEYTRPRARPGR